MFDDTEDKQVTICARMKGVITLATYISQKDGLGDTLDLHLAEWNSATNSSEMGGYSSCRRCRM